ERLGVPPNRTEIEGEARPLHAVILRHWPPAASGGERGGKRGKEIPGNEAGDVRREPGGSSVRECSCGSGGGRIEPLGEERRDDASQDVAGPGRRERCGTDVADDDRAVRRRHERVGAFQENG